MACGELGCSTELPIISEATFPNTVAVVVVAALTLSLTCLRNRFCVNIDGFLNNSSAVSGADLEGRSSEFVYRVTKVLTEAFCAAIRSVIVC